MSDVIDWSKAPEGYPIWIQGKDSYYASGWHRELPDRYQHPSGMYYMKRNSEVFTVHTRQQSTPWSGEGLPPVGTVCHIMSAAGHHTVNIRLYDGKQVVMRVTASKAGYCVGKLLISDIRDTQFLPIRTTEQIAADERDAAVNDMHAIYMKGAVHGGGLYAIYDAGYRKP